MRLYFFWMGKFGFCYRDQRIWFICTFSCKEPVEALTLEQIAERCHAEDQVCKYISWFRLFLLFPVSCHYRQTLFHFFFIFCILIHIVTPCVDIFIIAGWDDISIRNTMFIANILWSIPCKYLHIVNSTLNSWSSTLEILSLHV